MTAQLEIPPLIPTLSRAETGDAAFRRFVHATDRTLRGLARDLAAERIDAATWQHRMTMTLAEAHAHAGFLGRVRAGDLAPFDHDDTRFGALAAQEELPFLQAFAFDVLGDRYRREDGTLDAGRVAERASMYTSRLYGTANEALAWTRDEALTWHLGPVESGHCDMCPEIAAGSPYPPGRWPTLPGLNQTPCLHRCACWCSTESGLVGFRP